MRFLPFILLLASCASLTFKQTVDENIQVGDSTRRLVRVFGSPDLDVPSVKFEKSRGWYYHRGNEVCSFAVRDEQILWKTCTPYSNGFWMAVKKLSNRDILPEYRHALSE